MSKFLLFAIVGVAAYLIYLRGASIRKREISQAEKKKKKSPAETLVFDPKKNAYVPKKDKNRSKP